MQVRKEVWAAETNLEFIGISGDWSPSRKNISCRLREVSLNM